MNKKISYNKRVDLYYEDYDKYLIEIIKETIPRQLVSLYNHNLILKNEKLQRYIGSITEAFNISIDFKGIRKDVEKILKNKYNMVITSDDPLIMEHLK